MNATRDLARVLGAVEEIYPDRELNNKFKTNTFNFFLVLDFEATCWNKNDPNKAAAEIIEFSVVLYDCIKKIILDEFQQYVMPTESPKLTSFCTELTGINQSQVDGGVPLSTCLMLFDQWISDKIDRFQINFQNNTTFVTWSDWDLGICLKHECTRKRIRTKSYFINRIDLRKYYKAYYYRKPSGLIGALTELGLKFDGRQHCGLDDARNTAKLAGRMVSEGIVFQKYFDG